MLSVRQFSASEAAVFRSETVQAVSLGVAAFLIVAAHLLADFRWIVPAIYLLAFLLHSSAFRLTRAHYWLFAFLAYALLSCLWSPAPLPDIIVSTGAIAVAFLAFQAGVKSDTLEPVFIGSSLALIGYLIVVWNIGPFDNKNLVGEVATLTLIGTLAYRLWWFAPVPAATVLLCDNRGAFLALAATATAALWGRRSYMLGGVLLTVFVAGTLFLLCTARVITLPTGPIDTGLQRAVIWGDAIRNLTWLGHGIGSYQTSIAGLAPHVWHPLHAHNDWLQLVYVYGAGCLLLLPLYPLLRYEHATLVLIGFGVLAFVQSPASNPASLFIGAVCLGWLARRRDCRETEK